MFICLNEDLENPEYNGCESYLYKKGDYLYKIYNGRQSSFAHLIKLIERQRDIKKTILPDRILYKKNQIKNKCEYSLVGCRIKYFNNSVPLGNLNVTLNKKLIILEELIDCLKELLDNYIYPVDLHSFNVLFDDYIKIIDLDTFDTKITNDIDIENYNFVLKLFRHLLLEVIFDDYTFPSLSSLEKYLQEKKLNNNLIKDLTKENFDFEDANNLIYSLKK